MKNIKTFNEFINEKNEESGVKSPGAHLGKKQVRIIVSSEQKDLVKINKDKIIATLKKYDPDFAGSFFEATGKIVGTFAVTKMHSAKSGLKSISSKIEIEEKPLSKSLK